MATCHSIGILYYFYEYNQLEYCTSTVAQSLSCPTRPTLGSSYWLALVSMMGAP
eukprot:COSAG03_NODE_894_length_5464_cov_8.128984_6_plen_54_part_00